MSCIQDIAKNTKYGLTYDYWKMKDRSKALRL